ncbi:MAG: type II toxin-antitoxin system VapC family toxin [Chloroflexi bacterium]|nr:type II toxin-antitoxin system VapC family toxin [Chloroflexota bacterium]
MRFMLDTNICIYIIKRKPPQVLEKLRALSIADVGISSVTLAALEYGAAKSAQPEQNRDALRGFLAPLEISPFDDRAALHYAEIRAHLEKKGTPIGGMDMLIASHARSLSATLVTGNVKEFERVPGLHTEDWTQS